MDDPVDRLLEPPSRFQQPTAALAPPNIADPYADVLRFLDEPHRKGVIALLAVAFYDGWREVDPFAASTHAAIVATGRSDYPNQINNVLAFPGFFRGMLDSGAP